jgi:hypothetical protein
MANTRRNRTTMPLTDGIVAKRLLNPLKYFTHVERWIKTPGLNADIQSTSESVNEIVNKDWEVLGTNHTSALATFRAGGGLTITTATASLDEMNVQPHLDTKQSAVAQAGWNTAKEMLFYGTFETGAAIVDAIIWGGWKLTNTQVVATDNDQVFFRYEEGVNSGKWQFIYSISGTDTEVDTGITVAVSTAYELLIELDSSRIARGYINGVLVGTSTALASLTTLDPYFGIKSQTGGAGGSLALSNRALMVSQLY